MAMKCQLIQLLTMKLKITIFIIKSCGMHCSACMKCNLPAKGKGENLLNGFIQIVQYREHAWNMYAFQ